MEARVQGGRGGIEELTQLCKSAWQYLVKAAW